MKEICLFRSHKTTVRLMAMVLFALAAMILGPVRAYCENQPPSLPEVSESVEADTRKALEEMEEALMDQIQREDMQAAEVVAGNRNATAVSDTVPTSAPASDPDPIDSIESEKIASPKNVPAPQIPSPREPAEQSKKIPASVPAPAAVPQQEQMTKTPVYIRDSGVDQAGLRLGFFARETFSASSLFSLSNRNERKIVIRIDSKPEFPTRPALSSVFAATWILVEDEATVPYYLDTLIGVVSPDSARMEADRIVSRTARILEQYAYLFE